MWSGYAYVATLPDQDADLDNELATIEQTLNNKGPLSKRQLRDSVGAARWGPGRFKTAFNTAVEEERIERGASGTWRTARERQPAG